MPVQLNGWQFRKHRNDVYFDPWTLVEQVPSANFLQSILFKNYLHFFTEIGDVRRFLDRMLFIIKFSNNRRRNAPAEHPETDREAKLLLTLNTLFTNEHVNLNVKSLQSAKNKEHVPTIFWQLPRA